MRKMQKWVALLLAGGMLAGCSNGAASTEAAKSEKETTKAVEITLPAVDNELTMDVDGEIDKDKVLTTFISSNSTEAFNGNPYDSAAGFDWTIRPLLYDYLAYYSPLAEGEQYKLSLVEEYNYENQILTFKLLDGLKWSDGSVLDAEDVMTYLYCQVGRSTMWTRIDSIEKVDDLTVKVDFSTESPLNIVLVLKSPIDTPNEIYGEWAASYKDVADSMRKYDEGQKKYSYTEDGNAKLAVINEELLAYKPDIKEAVTSGPYVIKNNNTSEIIFEQNPHYRKEQKISTIRGLRGGDSQAFATALLGGEFTVENGGVNVDMGATIDEQYKDSLRKVYIPEMSQIGYTLNTNVYPLDQLEVRQAISMALQREVLASIAEPGSFTGNTYNAGLLPSMYDTYTDDEFLGTLKDYNYNVEEATKLLESIGWKKEGNMWVDPNGESPKITITTIGSWPTFMMTGEAMGQMLTEFGFNIEFKPLEVGVWSETGKSDDKMIHCCFVGGASTYAHPWESFNNLFVSNGANGWQKFEAGEDRIFTTSDGTEHNVTKMLDELYSATDEAEIERLTRELMVIANDLCGYISVVEKTVPLRIYDPSLHLTETEMNTMQTNGTYFGNLNDILAKMLLDDELYFVKE